MPGERVLITLHPPIPVPIVLDILEAVRKEYPEAMVESGPEYRVLVNDNEMAQNHNDVVVGGVG